jgi:hypothetical protein
VATQPHIQLAFLWHNSQREVIAIAAVFTIINNTSATPIAGTFSNLHDGSVVISNGNSYQVNYQGGDGNDLTLTVVP